MKIVTILLKIILIYFIKGYQYFISPLLPNSCRFIPSCSEYAKQSIVNFGVLKGGYLTILRLLKCHPFGGKGYDPVPCDYKKIKENNGAKSKL